MSDNPYNFFFLDDEPSQQDKPSDDFGESAGKPVGTVASDDTDDADTAPPFMKEPSPVAHKIRIFLHSAFSLPFLCLCGGALFVLLMLILPESAAAVGYLLGWSVTALYLYQGRQRSFSRPLIACLITLVISALVSFVWLFLSQTELYTIYDYLAHTHTWATCLFQCALGAMLACFGIYLTLPSKKKKQEPQE